MSAGPCLVVLSRDQAEHYIPLDKTVCISITDPGTPDANLHPDFAAVLRLKFHDLEPWEVPAEAICDVGGRVKFLDDGQAGEIVRFAAAHGDADVLVVHCEAGISRSRSVAEALFDEFDRRAPNRWVYQQVSAAFRRNWQAEDHPKWWIKYRWTPKRRGPR